MKASLDPLAPWLAGLSLRDPTVSEAECAALREVVSEVEAFPAGRDLIRAHDRSNSSSLVVEGWCCRYIDLEDGRRQITAIHIPGDFVDLHSFPLRLMDHSVRTLTPCRIARTPHAALKALTEKQPHLTRLLWLSTLVDAAIQRQWIVGLGQRPAMNNLAHLICELAVRLRVAGLGDGSAYLFPMTQAELGQALGITHVHANRAIQQLRRTGLVRWDRQTVEIVDWNGLQELAEFDPVYLNLTSEPR
jgi:CRP-like cAMP-binding protein